jgi:hypothetical protein
VPAHTLEPCPDVLSPTFTVADQFSPPFVDLRNLIPGWGPKLVHVINTLLNVAFVVMGSQNIHSLSSPEPPLPGTAVECRKNVCPLFVDLYISMSQLNPVTGWRDVPDK